ncbi:potassium transporter TrkG, partial [Pseudoalteromonas ruthenica]|uniref:potassium transporter TrkG n=1 Tax=Pseudoalteromonas ruthenica TaxID=151081 RepID=UPI001274D8E8
IGVGGMQLYRAETPRTVKDSKMSRRIADSAIHVGYIYGAVSLTCTLADWVAGMNWFDAICHAVSTIAIGGLSTYDASMGHCDSTVINLR